MVILSPDIESLTFDMLKNAALVLVILYALNKVISDIIVKIGNYTRKEEKIEKLDPEKIKHELMDQYVEDQKTKWKAYDVKIIEIEGKIDGLRSDFTTMDKDVKEELYLQTDCMQAVLDGLHQLNCNGPVSEASERLINHVKMRAYK